MGDSASDPTDLDNPTAVPDVAVPPKSREVTVDLETHFRVRSQGARPSSSETRLAMYDLLG